MYDTVVAIDLETTGPDPCKDHIIEVGAAVYEHGQTTQTFDELAQSPVPLSPGIIKLTSITPAMLKEARPLDAVLADFLDFLPVGALCLAHNAAFERAFLRRATKDRFKHTVLDTVGLSRICFPRLPSHSLMVLREVLDLPTTDTHRALADCETLLCLWERLLTRAQEIPLPVVAEINQLLVTQRRHPYHDFFRRLETEKAGQLDGGQPKTLEEFFPERVAARAVRELPDGSQPVSELDPVGIAGLFGTDGPFAERLEAFEHRSGQVEMAGAVVEAFNEEKHLLVEAGTGIGKSLAYLVPAVIWATTNETPVVVSTNTKNLQAQLFDKDLPLVREVLGLDFKAAIIKGRRNYLCLRKLFYALRQAAQELDGEERMRMLNILPWAVWSESGDISENIVWERPGFYALWAKLSTIGDECQGKNCRHRKRCFLRRARQRALMADVVVANHSLVFAELNVKSPALPPYQQIIFDEAHNLEAAATSHLSVELSLPRIQFALGRLFRAGRRGAGTGLVPSILFQLRGSSCSVEKELRTQAEAHCEEVLEALEEAGPEIQAFFRALEALLEGHKRQGSVRFSATRKREGQWTPIMAAKQGMVAALAKGMHALTALRDNMREMKGSALPYQRDFLRDMEANLQWLREITQDAEFVLEGSDETYVYWVERAGNRQGGARAWAAPTAIGPLLSDQIYQRKKTVVFSSATMTVRGSFDFLKKRLGIDLIDGKRLLEVNAGTPFDYPRQCLVVVPTFLPEPGERGGDYAEALSVLLAEVYRRSQGRGMALFTSHEMLRTCSARLQDEMLGDGIAILSQGMSGSRENITAAFKRDVHSVLLGTHSFWEGVDVVGEALSCLTIARLPFQVFTDPIVEARCERVEAEGENPFIGYSLPSAVIRFRQGFGRLIRHKTDHGVVVVADRRIVAKRYGKWFQESLPTGVEVFGNREELLDAVEAFLVETGPDAP